MTLGPLIAGDYLTLLDAAAEGAGLAQVPEPIAVEPVKDATPRLDDADA